jgi:hypothetical protein
MDLGPNGSSHRRGFFGSLLAVLHDDDKLVPGVLRCLAIVAMVGVALLILLW